ncbi:MerR family transcriptional regulator [Paenibacillus sp. 1P07SE]|uniref:MerR family transcriptional regulator n=1 Tax=Paenibacillus sp. 1P07SE TaxID=3132209 RepID=UPI0039A5E3A6
MKEHGNLNESGGSLTISEAAALTGLTADTLRYYEKIGLIESPVRGSGSQRRYSERDIGKVRFLTHLKRTHMPLKKIRNYVNSYNAQDEAQCYALLDEHRQAIETQMADLQETLNLIRYKLEHFQDIKDGESKER